MHGLARKLFVASLLALCVGIHALELSGHWDRTLPDANDEAGLVAIVLCVGVAVTLASTILKATPLLRAVSVPLVFFTSSTTPPFVDPFALRGPAGSPPLALRI